MRGKFRFIALIVTAFIVFLFLFGGLICNPDRFGDKVAVIDIIGTISESDEIILHIHQHRDNPSVKAVVLRIDSPGGGVAPVQEIYTELKKLNKPIIASMGNSAASGGYYLACAAREIFANPGTLTGSIGAVMQFMKMKDLYKKVGIEYQIVKSGRYKDIGSSQRDMTAEERDLLQKTIDDIRSQFIQAIFENRQSHLTIDEITEIADGRIFSGRQALELKLIDRLGNLPDAISRAAKIAGIDGTPRTIRIERKQSLWEKALGLPGTIRRDLLPKISFRYEMNP